MSQKTQTKTHTNQVTILTDRNAPLSFQHCLINVDVIAIRIKRTYETVIIQYIGCWKVGFIYEGGTLTEEQVLRIFKDAPTNRNDLAQYEKQFEEKVDILVPRKDNYVFIGERLVEKIKTNN